MAEAATRRELLPASRISPENTDAALSRPLPGASETDQDHGNEQTADRSADLGEVNWHTGGSEFYGPSGTFYFLAKLRSHASSEYPPSSQQHPRPGSNATNSVVNLLHSSAYTTSPHTTRLGDDTARDEQQGTAPSIQSQIPQADDINSESELEIQRECVRLYFTNGHCIHPVLDRASFITRCEKHIWFRGELDATMRNPLLEREERRFLPLFYVVLAIGAITAGETSQLAEDWTVKFLQTKEANNAFGNNTPYPPIRVTVLYFEKAKALMDNVFESTSFETVQTLFLMVCIANIPMYVVASYSSMLHTYGSFQTFRLAKTSKK